MMLKVLPSDKKYDKYRENYKILVDLLNDLGKPVIINKCSFGDDHSISLQLMFLGTTANISQGVFKQEIIGQTCLSILSDFVTAFYIPVEEISWFELICDKTVVYRFIGQYDSIPLEQILEESRNIPVNNPIIAQLNRVSTQADELIIDNVLYKRIVPIQPYIILVYSLIYIKTSNNCRIYIEHNMIARGVMFYSNIPSLIHYYTDENIITINTDIFKKEYDQHQCIKLNFDLKFINGGV